MTAPNAWGDMGGIEETVAARVLTALLRERYATITSRVEKRSSGPVLLLVDGTAVPLQPGYPFDDLRLDPTAGVSLQAALDTLIAVADPADADGVAAFLAEVDGEITTRDLVARQRGDVNVRLGDDVSPVVADARTAALGHPFHPTSLARVGLDVKDLLAYAPEFAPRFALRWAAVADTAVTDTASPHPSPAPSWCPEPAWRHEPPWWPAPSDVGLAADDRRQLFPVHPVTAHALPEIAELAPDPFLDVRPTLSMRTVAINDTTHLKVPMPVRTLGTRNRRSITLTNLADGATTDLLLREICPDDVLIADEQDTAHAGDPMLARMIRRLPANDAVTVAALPAPVTEGGTGTDGRTVADVLAARHTIGSREVLLDRYISRLLAWQVDLVVRYGISIEAHQQNLAVRFTVSGQPEFLVKDHDSVLIAPKLLDAAGITVPCYADSRAYTDDPADLVDVFVTITLHLSAAAIAFALLPAEPARKLVRRALIEALAPHGDHPVARLLRSRTLDTDRLVAKRMVTAATLVEKSRSGARDVNKFYGTDIPNYLQPRTAPTGHR